MTGRDPRGDDVVIVGMAARLPGAADLEQWWQGICEGVEYHHVSTTQELLDAGAPEHLLNDPRLVRRRPVIEDAESFDPELFGFTPREAAECDPQQRLFLEVCWELFENSGHDPFRDGRACGVFAGCGPNTYQAGGGSAYDPGAHFASVIGNERDFLAPRVAYKLGLQGPAISIVSGCATSLVALHLAVQSLQSYETDLAIAGGAAVFFPQKGGYLYSPGGINSPDGRCRAFSVHAQGTVHADGVGAVLLRRREDAESDGDTILGVVLGTAVTNDGAGKIGFTAPSADGEARAISEALAVAGLSGADIDYVETHGTATRLGDAIEVQALNHALAEAPRGSCRLGALKPNIGHTDTAAGVLGLIKVLLCFQEELLPPVAGLDKVQPDIDFSGPCRINQELSPWPRGERPRRAGISAFSIGGTNAHVIVEEPLAVVHKPEEELGQTRWLRFSAHRDPALQETMLRVADAVDRENPRLGDVEFTLAHGRVCLDRRKVVAIGDHANAAELIRAAATGRGTDASSRPLVFLFPGQGSQFLGMGADLISESDTFSGVIARCEEVFQRVAGISVIDLLAPGADPEREQRLNSTEFTQPALFAVEVALASVLMEWGGTPDALLGHSIGESAAAVIAGVLNLEDAAEMVVHRGRLIADSEPGCMAAVAGCFDEVRAAVGDGVDLAACNGAYQSVISGSHEAIAEAVERAIKAGYRVTRLGSSRAFHSRLLDGAAARFGHLFAGVAMAPPRLPMVWAPDGTFVSQAPTAASWAAQLRDTVRFDLAVKAVDERFPGARWVEVGPGKVLTDLVAAMRTGACTAALLLREERTDPSRLAASAWAHGICPEPPLTRSGHRIELPGLAMQRRVLSVSEPLRPTAGSVPAPPEPGDPLTVTLRVWAEEFGIPEPDPEADFFDLGGSSVLSARIAARLGQAFPVDIGPGHVMQAPATPVALAERVAGLIAAKIESMTDEEVAELLATMDRPERS